MRTRRSCFFAIAPCLFCASLAANTTGVGDYIAQGLGSSSTPTSSPSLVSNTSIITPGFSVGNYSLGALGTTVSSLSSLTSSTTSRATTNTTAALSDNVASGSVSAALRTTTTNTTSLPSTITACAGYQTALPNNTLGWFTTGPNLTIPGVVETWSCGPSDAPCNVICAADRPDCISSGSSIAHTCSPQWSAYSCSYSSYVSKYVTGSLTTAFGDIYVNTVSTYPTTSTANTSFTFQKWGGDTTVITPVYVFGSPTAVSTYTTTDSDFHTATIASSDNIYWSSVTDVESTYGTTYTTAWLDMFEYPLTDFYPVQTPACSITEVYSETCAPGGCEIYGGTVQVYYWPGVTPGPDGIFANTTKPINPSTTEISGITMTSPSVYVSFDTVYAANSCRRLGSAYTGSVLAFDPASISTVYGGPGFLSDDIPNGASVYNFGDLGPTVNAAAYEKQVKCIIQTGCSTIHQDYAPTISVPLELRSLDPAWSTCYGDFRGYYDPPTALQPAGTEATPSAAGGQSVTASPAQTVTSTQALKTGKPSHRKTKTSTSEANYFPPFADLSASSLQPVAIPTAQVTSSLVVRTSSSELLLSSAAADTESTSSRQNKGGLMEGVTPAQSGTSTQPASTGQTSVNPGGNIASILEDQSSAAEAASLTTQNSGDPGNQQTTANAGSIIASLLGASSHGQAAASPDPGQSSAQETRAQAATTADPGDQERSSATPVLTLAGSTILPDSSGNYVIGGQTLAPGWSAVVDSGKTYSLDPAGSAIVVDGTTQTLASSAEAATDLSGSANSVALQPLTLASTTLLPSAAGGYILGSQTLAPGSAAVTYSGTTYSLDPSASEIFVNGVAQTLPTAGPLTTASGFFVVAGQTYAEVPSSNVVVAGQTVRPESQTIISGTTYALDPSGSALVVNDVTQPLITIGPSATGPAYFVVDGNTYTELPATGVVIAGQTVRPGSQSVISGTTYSLDSSASALVIDGVTKCLANEAQVTVSNGYFVIDGQTYTDLPSSGVIIAGQTLRPGSQTVVSGTTYSLATSGTALVMNGVTQTLQSAAPSEQALTVGSSIFEEDPAVSGFVIGTQTLANGETATVGSGTARETLRMTVSAGETEVIFDTTSTEIIGDASVSPGISISAATSATLPAASASGSAGSKATAKSGASSVRRRLATCAVFAALIVYFTIL